MERQSQTNSDTLVDVRRCSTRIHGKLTEMSCRIYDSCSQNFVSAISAKGFRNASFSAFAKDI